MKYALLLVFALGVSAGHIPTNRKLNLFGLQQDVFPNYLNQFYGLRTDLPFTLNQVITPYMPLTVTPLINTQQFKTNLNIHDVYHKPILMMVRTPVNGEFDAFFLEHGLSTLTQNQQTRQIYENIQSGEEKSAVVVHPFEMYNPSVFQLFEGLKVRNFQVLPGIKTIDLIQGLNPFVPIVFLQEKEDLHKFDTEHLMRFGTLEITEEGIVTPFQNYVY